MTTNWREHAACRGSDPTVFDADDPVEGRRFCGNCPVIADCLAEALALRDVHGFRGGKTGDERRNLIKRSRRPRVTNPPLPAAAVLALHSEDWDAKAIATRLGVHADSVRRVLRLERRKATA